MIELIAIWEENIPIIVLSKNEIMIRNSIGS